MNVKNFFSAPFLTLISIGLLLSVPSVWSQGERRQGGSTSPPPVTKTRLEVQEFSKEFAQWGKSLTISTPGRLTFRWMTDEANIALATWTVANKPASSSGVSAAVPAPKVIRSGNLRKAPAKGHVAMFDIDFAQFAPKKPPQTPRTYWVFVTLKNVLGQAVGKSSVPVKIVYRASNAQPVKLGECFKNSDCYTGYFCNLNLNECRVIAYQCDAQFVRGSDGSKFDCTPYMCQAGQCLKTCASVSDCAPPAVCTYEGQCIYPPDQRE